MINFLQKLFGSGKDKRTEHEMFIDFMRKKKETLNNETEKAMMNYLEEIYKFGVKAEKKEDKKKVKVSSWVSRDKEIDDQRIREKEARENALPHPGERPI